MRRRGRFDSGANVSVRLLAVAHAFHPVADVVEGAVAVNAFPVRAFLAAGKVLNRFRQARRLKGLDALRVGVEVAAASTPARM